LRFYEAAGEREKISTLSLFGYTLFGQCQKGVLFVVVQNTVKGQWIGTYTGTKGGRIIVNIDELRANFAGLAYAFNEGQIVAEVAVGFATLDKKIPFTLTTRDISPVGKDSFIPEPLSRVSHQYPGLTFPETVDITGSVADGKLTLSWKTNLGTHGEAVLELSTADRPSSLSANQTSWEDFKGYVAGLRVRQYLFRGQNAPWRLRTSFHRHGRADVARFVREDVPALHKHLSARTRHVFNLANPDENGAFFNLVQHHGYPTPLLDWTYSPYVAAFFAYRGISRQKAESAVPASTVRILVFDQELWRQLPQLPLAAPAARHVSLAEFSAIENERLIPQQAASMITNIDDIESYIQEAEVNGRRYLWAYELPIQERDHVMQELSMMGITAGSLFPGLDGACEELKARNFAA
jgi:hypothetical protein